MLHYYYMLQYLVECVEIEGSTHLRAMRLRL